MNEFEEHIIRLGHKNNFIAALDSFITQKPSELYIQAIKNTKLKVISKSKYLEFINSTSENKIIWNKLLEQLVLQQMEREKEYY